jgi:thioesterase domain-containing protein
MVSSPQHIVPIRPGSGSGRQPIFLIHSIAGELTWVKHLARYLPPEQPLYSFAAPGINSDAPFFFSLEAMAQAYLRDIRLQQPHGPYLLGGYSMGGVLAFEITRQLQSAGEEIGLLVMIDAFAPHPEHGESITSWSRNGLLMQVICNQLALQWKSDQLLAPDILPPLPFTEHSHYVAQHLLNHCKVPHTQQALQSYLRRCQCMMRVHAQLLSDYRPALLDQEVDVLLFRNTLGLIGQNSALNLPVLPDNQRDPPHRWESFLKSPPVLIDVQEEHFMLSSEPAMNFISQALEAHLQQETRQ